MGVDWRDGEGVVRMEIHRYLFIADQYPHRLDFIESMNQPIPQNKSWEVKSIVPAF